jgi:RNA polymerase I-specific transcription initiation factor RRN6
MKNVRINVQAVLKNKGGSLVHYTYKGILEMTPESIAILTGSPDAKTTEFGKIFTHVNFETGVQELKGLETGIFVGCSRFLVEEGKAPVVESRISRVVYK